MSSPSTGERDVRDSDNWEQCGSEHVRNRVRMAQSRTFFPPYLVVSLALVMMVRSSTSAAAARRPGEYMHALELPGSVKGSSPGSPSRNSARSGVEFGGQVVRQEARRGSEQGFGDIDLPSSSKLKLFTHDVALRSDSGEWCWVCFSSKAFFF
jgi:hypothetical protein